jgi:hypothetical protein
MQSTATQANFVLGGAFEIRVLDLGVKTLGLAFDSFTWQLQLSSRFLVEGIVYRL